jgi:phosphatidylglycerophosphate synthase
MGLDLAISSLLLALVVVVALLYAVRVARLGAARSERVERAGASPILGKASMEATYWALGPIVSAFVALGIGANAITAASLVAGLAAGVALAKGHLGVAAGVTVVASLADALDGLVARRTGTASPSGEVFDAAADRFVEMFFLGGLAVLFRDDEAALVLTLLALGGSFMVSYSSAKAEALGVEAPRGAMRRAERAVVLGAGAWLTPFASALAASHHLGPHVAKLPVLAAIGAVAIGANVSAVRRLAAIATAVREPRPAVRARRTPIGDEPRVVH